MLTVEDLRTFIETPRGMVRCVNGISLTVAQGETLGLVGESGSGKTMTAMSIMGMVDEFPGIVSGRIAFANGDPSRPLELTDDLDRHITLHENGHKEVRLKKSWREWRTISNRRYRPLWGSKISMVFQDPLSSLNP
jgi:peptide/nickel transport system ATP-binding protein